MVEIWNTILLEPMLNLLVLLSKILLGNFGLAIMGVTVVVRVLMLPLTLRQLKTTKAMQEIQPVIKELHKKYAKDKQRLSQETMRLYKERGVNPLGCAFPMLIQLPIWIALYQSIIQALSVTPEGLLGLSKSLYSVGAIQEMVPLNSDFIGLNLAQGNFFMAVLVGGSMWMLQKMSTTSAIDPKQQSMSRMMTMMMPLMFGFFALSFPSGLSLYWILSNIISIVMQYRVTGWGTLKMPFGSLRIPQPLPRPTSSHPAQEEGETTPDITADEREGADVASTGEVRRGGAKAILEQKRIRDGKHRSKRQVRGRGRRPRPR